MLKKDKVVGQISVLKHYVGEVKREIFDHKYLELIVLRIMPLIRITRPDLVNQWLKDSSKYKHFEKRALLEISEIVSDLKNKLAQKDLEETTIKKCFAAIEYILDRKIYVFSSRALVAYWCLIELCDALLELGCEDLIRDYADIHYHEECSYIVDEENIQAYSCLRCRYIYDNNSALRNENEKLVPLEALDPTWTCPRCNSELSDFLPYHLHNVKKVLKIDGFKFGPSLDEFLKLKARIFVENKENYVDCAWFDWGQLCLIELCWNLDRNFYRRKKLCYDNAAQCERSARLLNFNIATAEIYAIKKKRQGQKRVVIYKQEMINKCLGRVLKKVFNVEKPQQLSQILPFSIEIELEDDIELRLLVEWAVDIVEVFHLHTFKNDSESNSIFCFIKGLLDQPGHCVEIQDVSGANAGKYLERVSIVGALGELFVAECYSKKAVLRSKHINLEDKTIQQRKKIIAQLQLLEKENKIYHEGWGKDHTVRKKYLKQQIFNFLVSNDDD